MKNIIEFGYWLSGALETIDVQELTPSQMERLIISIKDHLALVTDKVTPDLKTRLEPADIVKEVSEKMKKDLEEHSKKNDFDRNKVDPVKFPLDFYKIDPSKWPPPIPSFPNYEWPYLKDILPKCSSSGYDLPYDINGPRLMC
jgi:hypothetical protein